MNRKIIVMNIFKWMSIPEIKKDNLREMDITREHKRHEYKISLTLFERYQRNEKALLTTMLEMYVQGVSTRKASRIVEELCGKQVS